MNRDFSTWYNEVFKKKGDDRLYHEWLIDQAFAPELISDVMRNKIMLLVHEALIQGFITGEFQKLSYERELCSRVRVQAGKYKGKLFSELPGAGNEVWEFCIALKQSTKDPIIRQACSAKLNDLRLHKNLSKEYTDKKARRKR